MKWINIRIEVETHKKLQDFKKGYSMYTYSSLLDKMILFFENNKLKADTKVNLDLVKSLEKINNDFLSRDKSLRKWIGKMDNQFLTNIDKKLSKTLLILDESFKEDILENLNDEIKQAKEIQKTEKLIKEKNDHEINEKTEKNKTDINFEMMDSIIQEKQENILQYRNYLNEFLNNFTEKKDKYYLEISKEEYLNIKKENAHFLQNI